MGERIEIKFEFDDSTKTTGKYLVFDAETTGFPINRHASPDDFNNWPYIVQIAWILFDDEQKLIEHNDFYLRQPIKIPADATNIHGITTAMMLEKGIEPSIVYANFKKAIDNTEYIIAHNIDFDIPVVHCEFLRNGLKWDFPNNRLLCTMKTGANFCKIPPHRNGEYKWPKLTELYQNCFYPGHAMNIFPDATSTKNVHSANIDSCMTAQCFFKLKDLGLFKEFKSETTANSVSAKQTEGNFENLHELLDTWVSDNAYWVYHKIKHTGLGITRVVKDDYIGDSSRHCENVTAQFKKWDEQWAKIIHKNKSQAEKESSLKIAEERTRDAQEKQKQIDNLLNHTLGIDDTLNWDSFKNTKNFEVPNPKNKLKSVLSSMTQLPQPTFRELPKEPDKGLYEPQLSLVDKMLKSSKEKKIRQSKTLYQDAMSNWRKAVDEIDSFNINLKKEYEQKIKEHEEKILTVNEYYDELEKEWETEKKLFTKNQKEYNDRIEKLKENYLSKNTESVITYCEIVLNNSHYPETFPKEFDLDYNSDNKLLIVDYFLPLPDDLPTLTDVKYIASKKELKELFLSETQLSRIYDSVIYKITLRTLHELFEADKAEALEEIVFNGWVNAIDKATGKKVSNCIVTIRVKKNKFSEIELLNVDPKICFENLNGIGSRKLANMTAVQPIAQINKTNNSTRENN